MTRIEEHLLICETCRERLEEADVYTAAMRGAAQSLRMDVPSRARQPARPWFPLWGDAVAVGLALLVVALALGPWRGAKRSVAEPVAVLLETTRDSRTQIAPESRPLLLTADLTQLASYPAYRLEVVDAAGRHVTGSPSMPGHRQTQPADSFRPGARRLLRAPVCGVGRISAGIRFARDVTTKTRAA